MKIQKIVNWAAPLIGLAAIAYSIYTRTDTGTRTVTRSPDSVSIPIPPPDADVVDVSPKDIWDVVRVSDGDTITVTRAGEERRIRFCGIDAPEKNQPGGIESTQFLKNAIAAGGDKVGLTFVEQDRYGRWVAEVWANEQLLNSLQVVAGHAWPYKKYWGNCPNRAAIASSEVSAEQEGRALWKQAGAIAPWDWRRR